MGVVYEAEHETLGQTVAIKVLKEAYGADERAVRRFEREARLSAKLDSVHVVKVSDVDRTDDGVPFLVMERLVGGDLASRLDVREKAGPLPVSEAIAWACAICDGMIAAHAAGIVHRDLKLSNVFLTDTGVIKILDFGVAALQGSDPDTSTTTDVAGTPRYMAPEQLLGEPPNPASDVWAVGVILYRLLGGRFPYDAPTMAAQMLAIMEGAKPLDEVARAARGGDATPIELSTVVHRAMGRTLEERYESMQALRDALSLFAGETAGTVARASHSPSVSPARAPKRWRTPLVLLGILVSAFTFVFIVFVRRPRETPSLGAPVTTAIIPTETSADRTGVPPAPSANVPSPFAANGPSGVAEGSASAVSARSVASSRQHSATTSPRPTFHAPPLVPSAQSAPAASSGPRGDGFPTHL